MDDTLDIIATEFDTEFTVEPQASVKSDELKQAEETAPAKSSKTHSILVNEKQRGNPLLKYITNVPWEFEEIVPDYQMGKSACALFLSIRYHNLNPDYIHERLKLLGKMYELRVLLVLVDVDDSLHAMKHLTRICYLANLTLIPAQTSEEAGKVIETYKIYENKPPDLIMGKSEDARYLKIIETLTAIESVNNTDAMILMQRFHTLENIIKASEYQISQCPGFGGSKAKKLFTSLHTEFALNN